MHGREQDSSTHLFRALDSKRRVYEGSADFVVATLTLEGLGLQDKAVTGRWRSVYLVLTDFVIIRSLLD